MRSERVGGAIGPAAAAANSAVTGRLHEVLAADWSMEGGAGGVGGA